MLLDLLFRLLPILMVMALSATPLEMIFLMLPLFMATLLLTSLLVLMPTLAVTVFLATLAVTLFLLSSNLPLLILKAHLHLILLWAQSPPVRLLLRPLHLLGRPLLPPSGGAADDTEHAFLIINLRTGIIHRDTSDGLACGKEYPKKYDYVMFRETGTRLCRKCFS